MYVDGTRVGEAMASEETPHHIIHRLCELDLAVSDLQQPPQQKGVGFRLKLPSLMQGKHEVRCSPCSPSSLQMSSFSPRFLDTCSLPLQCFLDTLFCLCRQAQKYSEVL